MATDLPHLHSVHRKDRSGNIKYTDYYADRDNHKHSRINSDYDTRAFYREYFDYWDNKQYNVKWLIQEYLDDYVMHLSPNTQKQYRIQLGKLEVIPSDTPQVKTLKNNILKTSISFVNDFDFKKDVERLSANFTTATANIFINTLAACIQWGYIERKHSISDHALKYARKRLQKAGDYTRTSIAWSEDDWQRAKNCLDNNDPFYKILVVMRYTGMRIGDASQLTWEQIDFDNNTITLQPSKNGKVVGTLLVPLFPTFKKHLIQWQQNIDHHHYIICSRTGEAFTACAIDKMRYDYKMAISDKYGEEHYIQPHGLRKAIVVDYIGAGLTISQISSVLGWSHRTTQTMLDKHYFKHGNIQIAQQAMAQVLASQSPKSL